MCGRPDLLCDKAVRVFKLDVLLFRLVWANSGQALFHAKGTQELVYRPGH